MPNPNTLIVGGVEYQVPPSADAIRLVDNAGVTVWELAYNGDATNSGVAAGDALSLDGSTLNVNVDGTTIDINGSNELEIVAGGVDTTQIANGAVDTAQIANSAVDTTQLADGAVTADKLDAAAVSEAKLTAATSNALNAMRVGKWKYDFAVLGGAQGTIALTGGELPANAVILGGLLRVLTTLDSLGSATASIKVESAEDIVADAAFGGAPWSSLGNKAIIPVFTNATYVTTTQAETPSIVIATADLTAGVFDLMLLYVVADA